MNKSIILSSMHFYAFGKGFSEVFACTKKKKYFRNVELFNYIETTSIEFITFNLNHDIN